MKANCPSMGCWQMIPGANVSRTLARTGVDWVLVDCEHGNMDGEFLWGFSFGIAFLIFLGCPFASRFSFRSQ